MHPAAVAADAPDRPAIVMGTTGSVTTFAELDRASNRLAQYLRSVGVEREGAIAIFADNHPQFLEVAWGAQRAGVYYTAVNSHLSGDEAAYIVADCEASVVVASAKTASVAREAFTSAATPSADHKLILGAAGDGWERYDDVVGKLPSTPIPDEAEGEFMLYSSGTTGRPKGIKRTATLGAMGTGGAAAVAMIRSLGLGDGDTYLNPAPLYHAAPLAWSMSAHRLGASVIVMERFDPEECLALIERHRVTHAQFVPTMFVRMLKLPDSVRERYDVSSLRSVVHAAAPCPVDIKRAMIEWWGPVIHEYYSSTEGAGATWITSEEWLTHPGSVGRAVLGTPAILDESGNEVPTGDVGTVWFTGGADFEYHRDPAKTAEMRDSSGRTTVGDVGYLDEEGFLYLTDRKAFMIISGGVNVYPQEAEDVLIVHPKVADVAVLGVPDADLGEAVKAVVQPADWADVGPALEAELLSYCREHLSTFKCPRSIDFDPALPRLDTGKLYKKKLRDRYWETS